MKANNPSDPSETDDANLASFLRTEAKARESNGDGIWELLIEAAETVERLKRNLDRRDAFIGSRGLWGVFLRELTQ